MPRLIKNNIIKSAAAFAPRQELNNKTMKKEFIFPMIVGLLIGGLIMIFWQFNTRLNNAANAMAQLEAATAQNTKTVGEIVTFINNASGAQKQGTGKHRTRGS